MKGFEMKKCEKCNGRGRVAGVEVRCERWPIGCDCGERVAKELGRRIDCKAKLGYVTVDQKCSECGGTGRVRE